MVLCGAALGCNCKLISMVCVSSENTCWVINAGLGLSALPPLFTHCAIPCNSLGQKSSTEPVSLSGSLPLQQHFHTSALTSRNMWNSKIPEQATLSYLFLQDLFFSTQLSSNWKSEIFSSSLKLFRLNVEVWCSLAGSWWHFYFGGLSHQGIPVEQFCQLNLELMQRCHISKLRTQNWYF